MSRCLMETKDDKNGVQILIRALKHWLKYIHISELNYKIKNTN